MSEKSKSKEVNKKDTPDAAADLNPPEKRYPVRVLVTGWETREGVHARGNVTYLTREEIREAGDAVESM